MTWPEVVHRVFHEFWGYGLTALSIICVTRLLVALLIALAAE